MDTNSMNIFFFAIQFISIIKGILQLVLFVKELTSKFFCYFS